MRPRIIAAAPVGGRHDEWGGEDAPTGTLVCVATIDDPSAA
jgi:hypothetical protein